MPSKESKHDNILARIPAYNKTNWTAIQDADLEPDQDIKPSLFLQPHAASQNNKSFFIAVKYI